MRLVAIECRRGATSVSARDASADSAGRGVAASRYPCSSSCAFAFSARCRSSSPFSSAPIRTASAVALTLLLGGIAGAIIGSIAYQTGLRGNLSDISIGSLITGLVVLFVAFLIGGWAAGRIARYDGGRNGLMTAVWFLILTAIFAALGIWFGSEYNVVGNVNLPNWFDAWFSSDQFSTGAVISGIAAVLISLLGGFLGGLWGARYHKRADETIARTRSGGVTADYRRRVDDEGR
jgi:hypothetical protein